ncbi:MAG: outer membrane protein assembly factor BamA, partial [Limisphaerales bacterium]
IKFVLNIDENAGRGSVTFQIVESHKVKITRIEFVGAAAFPQKELRKQIKTKQHWMFSWLTGSGVFKQDQFDDDHDMLTEFYRTHGYLDFEIKDIKFDYPTTNTMIIRFYVYEGQQYKVGSIKFSGNKIFNDAAIRAGLIANHDYEHSKAKLGAHGLPMDVGDVFTPAGLEDDRTAVEDFYGSKGYIGENGMQSVALRVIRIPNVDTGTMDLEFQVDEGQKSYVEKINIHGNIKTKDKVIRRELAISPGETFDMVRVKISRQRLEGLDYFNKVEMRPEPTEPPIAGRKNLDVDVEEKNTGNLTFGAGFSTIDSLVGYVELTQGNFDLFHPPTFTGGGQKFRLRVQLGTERQDYEMEFIEPWFLNRKLALGVDLYRHELDFESPHNIFNETRTGIHLSLTRALWSDFFQGTITYTPEDVGISLNNPFHGNQTISSGSNQGTTQNPQNAPSAILNEVGDHFYQRLGGTLAYDTRNNSVGLPNHGQRTELDTEFSAGDKQYYRVEMKTDWFFPGIFPGDVLEASGRVGFTDSLSGGDVPFYDRYFLGGLYSLRGFGYRNVAPREFDPYTGGYFNEPIGGDSIWFGSLEYSIPILEKPGGLDVRFALFYDVGMVGAKPYSLGDDYDDNWGVGFHLNIPHLGPLRLDYGIPIHHDKFNGASGQFQFGVGYSRPF